MPHKPGHFGDEGGKAPKSAPAPSPAPAPAPAPAPTGMPPGMPPGFTLGPGGSLQPPSAPSPAPSPAAPPTTPPLPPGMTLGPGGSLEGATTPTGPTFTGEDMASGNFTPQVTPTPPTDTLGKDDMLDTGAKNFATAFDLVAKAATVKNQFTQPPQVQPPGTMAPKTITGTRVSLVTKPEVPVTEQVQVKVLATGISTGATQEITVIINP